MLSMLGRVAGVEIPTREVKSTLMPFFLPCLVVMMITPLEPREPRA